MGEVSRKTARERGSAVNARQVAELVNARKCSGYWIARCPAHKDRNPSLSIRQGKKGRVSVRCFSGCETKDVLASIGLSFGDLYLDADREAWIQKKREAERLFPSINIKSTRKPLGKMEATYRYTNRIGDLMAEKLRYEGKVFLWRTPKIGGGWDWKVDRETLPLYRLHEVISFPMIFICEGEKDADNLRNVCQSKASTTTAPNGAKSWKSEYAQYFKDKKVVILPDSDAPGLSYAKHVAREIQALAKSVCIVSVAPEKDVSDFLSHHSPAELSSLIKRSIRGGPICK